MRYSKFQSRMAISEQSRICSCTIDARLNPLQRNLPKQKEMIACIQTQPCQTSKMHTIACILFQLHENISDSDSVTDITSALAVTKESRTNHELSTRAKYISFLNLPTNIPWRYLLGWPHGLRSKKQYTTIDERHKRSNFEDYPLKSNDPTDIIIRIL